MSTSTSELIIDHGTPRGYNQHVALRIPSCESCRAAEAEKRRQIRERCRNDRAKFVAARQEFIQQTADREVATKIARGRALVQLGQEYPQRLARLINEELRKAGFSP